jgi:ParB-like chromosome segregation protein Spo0J
MSEEVINAVVDIAKIKPHPKNYRQHPDEQIAQLGMSHARLSQFRSVVLWQQPDDSYITLAGHGIIEAMKRNKVTQVRADIHPVTLSAADAEAILIADNLHAQHSTDDEQMLAELLQEQQNAGYDLSSLGSDDETLRQMLVSLGDSYIASDDSGKPDVQFKEFDESIADGLDTEMCQQCGKLCIKGKK